MINSKKTPIKISFFSDSICVGQGLSLYQGWVTKISKYFDKYGKKINQEILVINSSVNGRTSRQALEDMPYQIQSQGIDILYIQFGLNDCNCWQTDRGLPRVSLTGFKENLREIISRAERFGAYRILLNNNHPTSCDKFIMVDTSTTYDASNARYNLAIRELAAELPPLVSFQDVEKFFKANINEQQPLEKFLLSDGLHLSAAGHEQYFRFMRPIIQDAVDAVVKARPEV